MTSSSRTLRGIFATGLWMILLSTSLLSSAHAQLSYLKGQHVEPAFEGWRPNADGTISFVFGYFNENWEEEPNIPVGDSNFFSPGEQDRGQPTHFLPRRNRFTYEVVVPADWGDRELVWTLTSPNGVTKKAYASAIPDYLIDNMIIASETGSLGAGTSSPESRSNVPPVATVIGDTRRTVRVGEPLALRTQVTDDGLPKTRSFEIAQRQVETAAAIAGPEASASSTAPELTPEQIARSRMLRPPSQVTVGKTIGLFLSWNVYRGEGQVEFDPPQIKPWEDTRTSANSPWGALWVPPTAPADGVYETSVTFDQPGNYTLWGRADDGGLFHDQYIEVTVLP